MLLLHSPLLLPGLLAVALHCFQHGSRFAGRCVVPEFDQNPQHLAIEGSTDNRYAYGLLQVTAVGDDDCNIVELEGTYFGTLGLGRESRAPGFPTPQRYGLR